MTWLRQQAKERYGAERLHDLLLPELDELRRLVLEVSEHGLAKHEQESL